MWFISTNQIVRRYWKREADITLPKITVYSMCRNYTFVAVEVSSKQAKPIDQNVKRRKEAAKCQRLLPQMVT